MLFRSYRYSQTELNGTARYLGMGGAFGALGGDISSMSSNPAGLGIYRSSEIVTTLSLSSIKAKSDWGGSKVDANKTKFNFDNIAYVGYFPTGNDEGLIGWNVGFSYNRVKNFNRNYRLRGTQNYSLTPVEYIAIHRRLFKGIFSHAGQIRDYNITKNEWVLKGATVLYASAGSIRETLDYDFSQEKIFDYKGLNIDEAIKHIAQFASGIWQIHAFGEGNTRTTAVFIIKYLHTFGFNISNEAFTDHSWYFRNALVRANYNDLTKGIYATTEYIEKFFRNLILGEQNALKNRHLQIGELEKQATQSAKQTETENPKCKNCTLDCTLEEMAVLKYLKEKPNATQKEIAQHIGKSERTESPLSLSVSGEKRRG